MLLKHLLAVGLPGIQKDNPETDPFRPLTQQLVAADRS